MKAFLTCLGGGQYDDHGTWKPDPLLSWLMKKVHMEPLTSRKTLQFPNKPL